jgi:DNA-binding GntR family transcriptional regulator
MAGRGRYGGGMNPDRPPAALAGRPAGAGGGVRLAAMVYDLIKVRLLEGHYAAGEPLTVEVLKAEFGVSKQPVMDALRRLSADGLVAITPQVGCQVVPYSRREVEDFFAMFGGFEGAVAAAAAARRTEEQLRRLDTVSAAIGALRREPDAERRARGYRTLNREFHAVIHDMAHSRVMAETSHRMWDLSDFLINTTGLPQPLASAIEERHDDHERIRSALAAGDAAAARTEMEQHITGTVAVIRDETRASGVA